MKHVTVFVLPNIYLVQKNSETFLLVKKKSNRKVKKFLLGDKIFHWQKNNPNKLFTNKRLTGMS